MNILEYIYPFPINEHFDGQFFLYYKQDYNKNS